jgi:hypothetical protein
MEKPKPTSQPKDQALSPIAHLAMVGVALGLSYAAFSVAVDKGSILLYLSSLALFVLGVKHLVQAIPKRKEK